MGRGQGRGWRKESEEGNDAILPFLKIEKIKFKNSNEKFSGLSHIKLFLSLYHHRSLLLHFTVEETKVRRGQ